MLATAGTAPALLEPVAIPVVRQDDGRLTVPDLEAGITAILDAECASTTDRRARLARVRGMLEGMAADHLRD